MVDHPTPSRTIVLTVLASLTAVSLVGCGKSPKEQARERNACAQDRNSEDCQNGGRSHSGMGYLYYGRGHYGQPSYYASPATSGVYNGGWVGGSGGARGGVSAGSTAPSASSSVSEGGSGGHVTTGGFGASAAGHAGGGGGGE